MASSLNMISASLLVLLLVVVAPQRAIANGGQGGGTAAVCPRGSGKANTPRAVCPAKVGRHLLAEETAASRSLLGGSSSKAAACCPCAAGFRFVPFPTPVAQARCNKCPQGSTPSGFNCVAPAGSYFDSPACRCVKRCPPDSYCLGGNIGGTSFTNQLGPGANKTACPPGTSTNGVTGATSVAACSNSFVNGTVPFTAFLTLSTVNGPGCRDVTFERISSEFFGFNTIYFEVFGAIANITLDNNTLACTQSNFSLTGVRFQIGGVLTPLNGLTPQQVIAEAAALGATQGANLCLVLVNLNNTGQANVTKFCPDTTGYPVEATIKFPPPPVFVPPPPGPAFTLQITKGGMSMGQCEPLDTIFNTNLYVQLLNLPFVYGPNTGPTNTNGSASVNLDDKTYACNSPTTPTVTTISGTLFPYRNKNVTNAQLLSTLAANNVTSGTDLCLFDAGNVGICATSDLASVIVTFP